MSDILNRILAAKKAEIEQIKEEVKPSDFENLPFFERVGKSLKANLSKATTPQIIAEFKRQSPSAGVINEHSKVQQVVKGYEKAGAAAVSVLTNEEFFGGTEEDLKQARQITEIPLLRKDFIVDEIQLYISKSLGADVILLIAEALSKQEIYQFAKKAKEINLEVLLELHSAEQLDKINEFVDFVGVNNRNLDTFEVNLEHSISLAKQIPAEFIKISESGISSPQVVADLYEQGFKGFLIGGYFMQHQDPVLSATDFIKQLK